MWSGAGQWNCRGTSPLPNEASWFNDTNTGLLHCSRLDSHDRRIQQHRLGLRSMAL